MQSAKTSQLHSVWSLSPELEKIIETVARLELTAIRGFTNIPELFSETFFSSFRYTRMGSGMATVFYRVCFNAVSVFCTVVLIFALAASAQNPAAQRTFALRYKPADEVAKLLEKVMPNGVRIEARTDSNELVVNAQSQDGLNYAADFIRVVDRPVKRVERPVTQVRVYPCPAEQQAAKIADLESRYGDRPEFRVSGDANGKQLFVIATPGVHAFIEKHFASFSAANSAINERTEPRSDSVRFRSPQVTRPSEIDRQGMETKFISFNGNGTRLQQQLVAVLGNRLGRDSSLGRTVYTLRRDEAIVAEFEFDARRQGVLVSASRPLLKQCQELIQALENAQRTGDRRTAIMSIERSDRRQLRQAIDAYRGEALNPDDSSSRVTYGDGGLALVNFVLQDSSDTGAAAEGAGAEGEAADEELPGAQMIPGDLDVDVEVQTLPDLDVIILRGRDRDVNRLTDVIRELERLSEETQPEIRIYDLQHAQSESVANIIDNVNEDLTGGRQGRVSVTPLVKPNSLLLIGWGDAIQSMLELITKLDTAVGPETQFDVYRLKHATAQTVVSNINDFYSNRDQLGPKVTALADVRSNSVIVYAAPRDLREVRRLIESLDVDRSATVNQAKIIKVENALAEDLAQTLQEAIQGSNSGDGPSAILELLTIDRRGEQMVRSGMLSDVSITANARNNTLIVSGPPDSIPLLEMLIEQMDTPGAVAQIKVFRVNNGDAASLVQMLRSLLPSQTGASTGPQLSSAEGDTSLAPLRFAVDSRTNSIIAAGSEGDLQIIEALLLRLDERDFAERRNEVYRLRNAPALDVAAAINEFLRSERLVQQAVQAGDFFEQVEREVVVVPEPVRNALIISATPRYFDQIRELIVSLDEQPPQVLIQVVIAEVMLKDTDEFGVELGIQDSVLFDRSLLSELVTTTITGQESTADGIITVTEEIIQSADNLPGFNFNNQNLGNSGSTQALSTRSRLGSQALTSFAMDRVSSNNDFGGLVLSASSDSISLLIRALQESRRLDVLSRPQIRTLDNQSAFIQVGQRVPRITASNITDGGLQTNTIELENVGLILGVTPRISPDGMVVMEVDAEKSQVGPDQDGIPVSVSLDGTIIRSPRVDIQTAQATVSAASGETIILGGLITSRKESASRRIPYLSQIPLLGDIFRYDYVDKHRSELLIILTPHVIRNEQEAARIKHIEMARMSWCAADVYEIQGDVGASFDHGIILDGDTEVIYPDINPRGEKIESPEPMELDETSEFQGSGASPVLLTDVSDPKEKTGTGDEETDEEPVDQATREKPRVLTAVQKLPARLLPRRK